MKVMLIFPPLWAIHRPYLSLPSLTGYLQSHGIDVVQKDFNLEAYDVLLSKSNLEKVAKSLQNKFENLNFKDHLTPGFEQKYYCDLFRAKCTTGYVSENIEKAKSIFRSKRDYYDLNKLTSATKILNQAQDIIALDCFPSGFDLIWPRNVRFQRSLADIESITKSNQENPFIDLYEHLLLPFISSHAPDIIGISIVGERQLIPALTLSRFIKSNYPQAHVVVGGYVVTLLADVLTKYPELFTTYIDSAILYEGERPLLQLVETISKGKSLNDVPNLIYFDRGRIHTNQVATPENINLLPTPCFDGLPLNSYFSPDIVLPLLSSRGCYWGKCAFCSHNESYRWTYQIRDTQKVIADIQTLKQKHRVFHFGFSDEAISPKSMGSLSDAIIDKSIKVRCSTNIRLEKQFTPELSKQMFDAGFRLLYVGLESGCNRVLDHMQKGICVETASAVLKTFRRAGIWNHVYAFFGFPTETIEEAHQTIDFLISNQDDIHSFGLGRFILNKGADVVANPLKYGISNIELNSSTEFNFNYAYMAVSGLSSQEAQKLSEAYQEYIANAYKHRNRQKLYYEDILLYLSHFEQTDPYLISLPNNKPAESDLRHLVTLKSIPVLKTKIVLDTIRFDIEDIIVNHINPNRHSLVYYNQTHVIFNPVSEKLTPIASLTLEMLILCNGKNNVKQIIRQLSKRHKELSSTMRSFCVDSLAFLSNEGYLDIVNEAHALGETPPKVR